MFIPKQYSLPIHPHPATHPPTYVPLNFFFMYLLSFRGWWWFGLVLTILNCLWGKNFTSITYISGSCGAGKSFRFLTSQFISGRTEVVLPEESPMVRTLQIACSWYSSTCSYSLFFLQIGRWISSPDQI